MPEPKSPSQLDLEFATQCMRDAFSGEVDH